MKLLIDCGNTRIKWATGGRPGDAAAGSVSHRDDKSAAIAELARIAGGSYDDAVFASVLDEDFNTAMSEALAKQGLLVDRVRVQPEKLGLTIAYVEPERLGVDRWLAMIAARARVAGAVCIVSAGTAVTFDAVDAAGRHLGGLIWPGPHLVATALAVHTARIGATPVGDEKPPGIDVLGNDTGSAVGNGSLLAIGAAIDRAVRIVARSLGAAPAVVLTGGDADLLSHWVESTYVTLPDLVLDGLRIVAADNAT